MTLELNLAEVLKNTSSEEILKKRIKRLIQECMENPEVNLYVLTLFFNRKIEWKTIDQFIYHGKPVECRMCKEKSFSGYWCQPCVYPDRCCHCCILLGAY